MADSTLKILHFPPTLSSSKRDELLKKYGATKTKTIFKSGKYSITFAEFPNKEIATKVFFRLHQLEIKGRRLSVEFSTNALSSDNLENLKNDVQESAEKNEAKQQANYLEFLKKLNSWSGGDIFCQPPPPNLWYKYPEPSKDILLRILVQLLKEPVFYCQVLHLMNRMNLPPPFSELESEFPVLQELYEMEKYQELFNSYLNIQKDTNREFEEKSETESEIESDTESIKPIIPMKRKNPQSSKPIKIPKFINPTKQKNIPKTKQKSMKPEECFESIEKGEGKNLKIELKSTQKLPEIPSVSSVFEGGFGKIFSTKAKNVEEKEEKTEQFITSDQLAQNRISENDWKLLPVFKNYVPGKPTCRLYLKNLSENVDEQDLHFIYKKYLDPKMDNPENEYALRLMKEGRMRNQAFVTLQNVAQGQLAREETNGYILKDKPMVVQFAKSKT